MKERLIVVALNLSEPDEGSAGSADEATFILPVSATLVYASASPKTDDAEAAVDIKDDGVAVVSDIDASDHSAPGEWATTGYGGSQTPVHFAASSVVTVDITDAAVGNRFDVYLWFLTGV